ncbi:dihydroxyacetone kinase family protein [Streptomyces sp. NPDC002851]
MTDVRDRGRGFDEGADSITWREAWLDGLVLACGGTVRRVPDAYGIVARQAPRPGKVAVVIGGGSGHYPAFAGLVGPGLADGAAIGDVFASPSAEQVYRTAKAADGGAGVLLSYGNYAGDVMHFGLAAKRLAAEGIATRTVLVTDDVSSGPPPVDDGTDDGTDGVRIDPSRDRRGVAGDFFVFKVAGAAAERGDDLDTVTRLARRANAMTRTFGAAFAGCTLPGAEAPLFTVNEGTMELGMGIHGEPGLRTTKRLSPEELAAALVENLLPEVPTSGDGRVAVLLNGLGRTKGEELFTVYGHVHRLLVEAGLTPYRPEVGEFVTSFDMAGMSLSLMALDDELAELYDASCDTPAYRPSAGSLDRPTTDVPPRRTASAYAPDHAAQEPDLAASPTTAALQAALDLVAANEAELGRLDAVAGDGDHGIGIVRGLRSAVRAARAHEPGVAAPGSPQAVGSTLMRAGLALADASGGASGALYGAVLTEAGASLTDAARDGHTEVSATLYADAADRALAAVSELGGAQVGEKTMLDALDPFRKELRTRALAGAGLAEAWTAAASVAAQAAAATAGLKPTRGRAARMGDLGHGHADAGATSMALILGAIGETLAARTVRTGRTASAAHA